MRIIATTAAVAATIAIAACQKPADNAAPATTPAATPQPAQTMAETFTGCTWGEAKGGGVSVWGYDCPADHGSFSLVADETTPGISIVQNGADEGSKSPAIIVFKKAADAPIDSILPAVRPKSPGPHTAECVFAKTPSPEGDVYGLEPVGAVKTAWDAFSSGENAQPVDAPCGDMGPQMSGDRGFRVLADDPTTVVFIEYGSEIQPFDFTTIRSLTPVS